MEKKNQKRNFLNEIIIIKKTEKYTISLQKIKRNFGSVFIQKRKHKKLFSCHI